jgi:hypothetical protein
MIRNDLDPLILDLLEWIDREPRSYAAVIDAWRTSCPRLTVWEDAMDRGFVVREPAKGREVMIRLTAEGHEFLRDHGRVVGGATLSCPGRDAARSSCEAMLRRTGTPVSSSRK